MIHNGVIVLTVTAAEIIVFLQVGQTVFRASLFQLIIPPEADLTIRMFLCGSLLAERQDFLQQCNFISAVVFNTLHGKGYLPLAILLHILMDTFAALYQRNVVPLWSVEVWSAIWTVTVLCIAVKLYRKMKVPLNL